MFGFGLPFNVFQWPFLDDDHNEETHTEHLFGYGVASKYFVGLLG